MDKLLLISITILVTRVCLAQTTTPQPAFEFLIHYPNVRDFTMNTEGTEAFFTLQNPLEELAVIVCITKINEKWSDPVLVPFTGQFRDIEPSLSTDGLRLYFSSDRPSTPNSTEAKDYDIWFVERKNDKSRWSSPVQMPEPINSKADEFYPCTTISGNFYFTSDREGTTGRDDIFLSKQLNGFYSKPEPLPKEINTAGMEFNAFIPPDEKFILYTGYQRAGGVGSGDLFISYKNPDGTWSESLTLGKEINSTYMDYCPFVDLKTKTLYFTSRRSDISKTQFSNVKEFESVANGYANGFSRIYKVSIANFLK